VHELGHVLGMAHEHSRPGRDNHVKFQCQKLSDFDEKLEELRQMIPSADWLDLCLSLENASRVGAGAQEYIEGRVMDNDEQTGNQWPIGHHDRLYDTMSVMNYPSDRFSHKPCWGKIDGGDNVLAECPLA
jgi:hypothetical protein